MGDEVEGPHGEHEPERERDTMGGERTLAETEGAGTGGCDLIFV